MFFTEGSICHKPLKDNMNIEFENIVRENDNLQMVEKSIKERYKNIIIDCPFEYLVNNYMLYPHYQTKIILIEKLKSIIQDNKDVNLFLSIQGKIPHNELEESYRPQIFDHSIYQNSSLLLYTYQECGRIRVEIVKNRYGYNKDRELYL